MLRGSFEVSPGVFMAMTCHHSRTGACGPCYARLVKAIERVEAAPTVEAVKAIVAETHQAMVAEAKPAKKGGPRA
jgi:hypothetical protein